MGSLMAGWNSPVHGFRPDRNKSLTKEYIAAFWRLKKIQKEQRLLKDDNKKVVYDGSEPSLILLEEERMEPLLKKQGWWMSSNWAFLNEAPLNSSSSKLGIMQN